MSNPSAAILVIGDEILSGRTQDTNTNHLAVSLTNAAIDLKEVRVVSDDQAQIVAAVNELRARWDNVFTSGGIGPTHDDITADAMAVAFGVGISVRDDARAILQTRSDMLGIELNEARLRMARIPDGAVLIDNPVSGAPGFSIENVHVMAGVPAIFKAMVATVLPTLTGGMPVISKTVRLDMPEGEIAAPLGELAKRFSEVSMGSYPFVLAGRFGTNIVLRSSDTDLLAAAFDAFIVLFPNGQPQ
ncbi:MAG: molybdopterin-binding protein [Rhodobacterales bacterium]|jgi:molybdenum cofactor synthesis domain-containing protein|nr:molybdopterin-binding protein [Pseudomonadota bacterium]MDA1285216.1 molybdopterin-binding protein [Pseudomonadota bacterium]NQW14335.1 competence/damage-inducible protein A [Rhodobacter sp.]